MPRKKTQKTNKGLSIEKRKEFAMEFALLAYDIYKAKKPINKIK